MPTEPELAAPLKNPKRAALLAWLFPGLGHLYQGRTTKGVLFMVSIVGLFLGGMAITGGRVAYASSAPITPLGPFVYEAWPFLGQSGIGAVALPGWYERARYRGGEGPTFGGLFYPPRVGQAAAEGPPITSVDQSGATVQHPDEAAKWRYEYGYKYDVGMIYAVIAGLLNILVVYDAHSGPLILPTHRPRDDPKPNQPEGA